MNNLNLTEAKTNCYNYNCAFRFRGRERNGCHCQGIWTSEETTSRLVAVDMLFAALVFPLRPKERWLLQMALR